MSQPTEFSLQEHRKRSTREHNIDLKGQKKEPQCVSGLRGEWTSQPTASPSLYCSENTETESTKEENINLEAGKKASACKGEI